MEFTQCIEEAVTEIQLYYDGILLKQNEIIEELTRRVDRLEKTVYTDLAVLEEYGMKVLRPRGRETEYRLIRGKTNLAIWKSRC